MVRTPVLALFLTAGLLAACGKKTEPPAPVAPPAAPVAPAAPAAPAAPVASAASAATETPEVAEKRKALEFALLEDGYKNDPLGQWAVDAKASSTYASPGTDPTEGYHPMRATGAPDVETYSDSRKAWASKTQDSGIEWLELSFIKPVNATEVRIRQNLAPGAIVKVELFDASGTANTVFQGLDATVYARSTISWLNIKVPATAYKTQRVKITLATNSVPDWNEIDAVQLVGQ